MHRYVLGFLLIFGALAVQQVSADTLQNCGSCGGVVYTLTAIANGAPVNGQQYYDFKLVVDTTHIDKSTNPGAKLLTAVALKVPGASGATLSSAPNNSWVLIPGGTNSGGCKLNLSNGFDCAGSISGVTTGPNDIYTFIFGFKLPTGMSGDLTSGIDLKAVYDSVPGTFGGLQTSETFAAPVPEPGSLSLLAAGLAVAGLMLLKRRQSFRLSHNLSFKKGALSGAFFAFTGCSRSRAPLTVELPRNRRR